MTDTKTIEQMAGAKFSECRRYRYSLWRVWDTTKPKIMFIGLNPSTANETKNDPTIRRVIEMAKAWGFGGVYMMNLFAWVSAYPEELLKCDDPVGENDDYLTNVSEMVKEIVFCWGAFKEAEQRANYVKLMFPYAKALIINKDGSPRHPLYVRKRTQLIPFNSTNKPTAI